MNLKAIAMHWTHGKIWLESHYIGAIRSGLFDLMDVRSRESTEDGEVGIWTSCIVSKQEMGYALLPRIHVE